MLMRVQKGVMGLVGDIKGMWVCGCLLRSCGCVGLVSDIKGVWVCGCLLRSCVCVGLVRSEEHTSELQSR